LLDDPEGASGQLARVLSQMHQQTHRMQRIVEDLLLLSRLESDQERADQSPVSTATILESIRQEAVVLSGAHGHRIDLEADATLGLVGNAGELRSAFSNLVFNAVRYTPDGGRILMRWWADAQGAYFAVTDTGVGIAAEHLPRLTERFYRVDVARSRVSGGTGLGLAIVKHVLTRHDAQLHIESEVGKGSTFTCQFASQRAHLGLAA
jgi:two-component system phosphate regulon sensor histidine kinase PhoR